MNTSRHIPKRIGATVILLCLSLLAEARTYSSPELGFSIHIDETFSPRPTEDDGLYVFDSADGRGRITILNRPGLSMEAVRESAIEGYRDEDVELTARGAATECRPDNGWGMTVPVSGIVGQQSVVGILGGFVGDQGQGFLVLIAASPGDWPRLRPRAEPLFASIAFGRYTGGAEAARWRRYLQGKRLAYRSTYDGGSSREDYYLCSDGRFLRSRGTHDFADAPGVSVFGQSQRRGAGGWRIQSIEGETYLIFEYDDGRRENARLEDRNGKTLLNGSRYYVVESDQCG